MIGQIICPSTTVARKSSTEGLYVCPRGTWHCKNWLKSTHL